MPRRLVIDPLKVTLAQLAPAVRLLLDGGVVAGPTHSFYALMALVDQPRALEKILDLKGRQARRGKPLLIMLDQEARARCYARETPPAAEGLMARFWPGLLTIILPAYKDLHPSLLGPGLTVGLRVEGQKVVRMLARMADRGLTGPSANPGGAPPPVSADEVAAYFGEAVDLILDGGPTIGGEPSTIIDAALSPPRLVRSGPLAPAALLEACPALKID
ncbi:MAG: threonylcarbamoyl-AMP synthase [Candidatus Adiutrix sp.]|jgi:L-threonylcarbamoyladenylate synthase|nr:threonylcarbamoyl-AMP synthase [Candidatus Adiutrix sp.]